MQRHDELSEQSMPRSFAASRYISFVENDFLEAITLPLLTWEGCTWVEKERKIHWMYSRHQLSTYVATRTMNIVFLSSYKKVKNTIIMELMVTRAFARRSCHSFYKRVLNGILRGLVWNSRNKLENLKWHASKIWPQTQASSRTKFLEPIY